MAESFASIEMRARTQLSNGFAEHVVLQNLMRSGVDDATARKVLASAKANKGKPLPAARASSGGGGGGFGNFLNGNLILGLILLGLGLGLTALSFHSGRRGGFVFYGMMIGGIWRICAGIMGD